MKKIFFSISMACLFIIFSASQLFAVPAYPHPVNYNLPDGSAITIRLKGNEKIKWAETEDGYSILLNKDGFYEYAVLKDNNDMVRSGIRAYNPDNRSDDEKAFVNTLSKHLRFNRSQTDLMRQIWDVRVQAGTRALPTTGSRKLICILIGYTDLAFSKTQQEFIDLFNQVGYNADGATGSVRDYYLENSWGQLDFTVDVTGPYIVSQDVAYYGANDPDTGFDVNRLELIAEAINLADPHVNYAHYVNNEDGEVDCVYVIYAGYGEEAGGGADRIHAHGLKSESRVFEALALGDTGLLR